MENDNFITKALLPLTLAVVITPLLGQNQPTFEAASVKRTDGCSFRNSVDAGMVALHGDPLSVLLTQAFNVKRDQIIGPSWLDTDCFAIDAKIPEGATKDQLREMFHALLVERFKLAAHIETRLRAGYALVIDKNGPKLKESDPNSRSARAHAGQVTFGATPGVAGIKGAMTLASLARHLSTRLDAPVEDLTGLKGTYDIDLSWVPDRAFEKSGTFADNYAATHPDSPDASASLPSGASNNIFSAIRESLGLRLESRKQQVEVVVIDHLERIPTAN